MVRVQLPYHLQSLAHCDKEVTLEVSGPVSVMTVVRALEANYPMLRGAILDHETSQRRPKIRFFACQQDYSLQSLDTELPVAVARGEEPLLVIGAISGG
jgi:molybdopterin converting factor small subunit